MKASGTLNIAMALIWILLALSNSLSAMISPQTAMTTCIVSALDLLISRFDAIAGWSRLSGNPFKNIYDKRMNKYAIFASIGSAAYMTLGAADYADYMLNNSGLIGSGLLFDVVALLFLLPASYALSINARKPDNI